MKKLFVIKIGGNIIDDENQLSSFLNDFSKIKKNKILVHGGGKIATKISRQLGIEPKMIEGRRITDADTLKVMQMVYGGLINKNIVAQLQSRNCNAIGLSGADGNSILAKKRAPLSFGRGPILSDSVLCRRAGPKGLSGESIGLLPRGEVDYGFAGDIVKINEELFFSLLHTGVSPVIAPLTHDGKGQLLNTNADTMASAIAVSLSKLYEVNLIYCFEKSGVLKNIEDENSVIEKINSKEYEQLKGKRIIYKGMIPKLDNAFDAIKQGVKTVMVGHAMDLKKVISNKKTGTRLEL